MGDEEMNLLGVHRADSFKDPLFVSLTVKLDNWPALSGDPCIYRVPSSLLVKNVAAYTPQIVSIGPIHHGKVGLEAMEEQKQRFLKEFLRMTNVELKEYVKFMKGQEARLRACYDETIELTSDEFVEVMMIDAAFLAGFLLSKSHTWQPRFSRIFKMRHMRCTVEEDVLLLENQLPLFLIKDLFEFANIARVFKIQTPLDSADRLDISGLIIKLIYEFFCGRYDMEMKYKFDKVKGSNPLHILDCLRSCHLSTATKPVVRTKLEDSSIPSVTELHQAGVTFARSSSDHILDIDFKNGLLTIPYIFLGDCTEQIFRNLLAFEQCHYTQDLRLTDYCYFMDKLISSPQDIDRLVNSKILKNSLGDNEQAAVLFNSLPQGLLQLNDSFYYGDISKQLMDYYGKTCNWWMANLRQNYCSTPCATISIIAATILLLLTVIQTVFTILG